MSTTIQYKTIYASAYKHADAVKKLDKSINLYLEAGWDLYGSPYAIGLDDDYAFPTVAQAIIKRPDIVTIIEPTHIPSASLGE